MTTVSSLRPAKSDAARSMPRDHARVLVLTRQRDEPIGPQRVEADVEPLQAGARQRLCEVSEQDAVRGHGEVGERLVGKEANERGEVPPQQRFAAGQPDLVDAQGRRTRRPAGRSPRSGADRRARAIRTPLPACSTRSGGCSGRSPTRAGCEAAGRGDLRGHRLHYAGKRESVSGRDSGRACEVRPPAPGDRDPARAAAPVAGHAAGADPVGPALDEGRVARRADGVLQAPTRPATLPAYTKRRPARRPISAACTSICGRRRRRGRPCGSRDGRP